MIYIYNAHLFHGCFIDRPKCSRDGISSTAHDCYKAAGLEAPEASNIKILCKPSLGNQRRPKQKQKKKKLNRW